MFFYVRNWSKRKVRKVADPHIWEYGTMCVCVYRCTGSPAQPTWKYKKKKKSENLAGGGGGKKKKKNLAGRKTKKRPQHPTKQKHIKDRRNKRLLQAPAWHKMLNWRCIGAKLLCGCQINTLSTSSPQPGVSLATCAQVIWIPCS